MRYVTKPIPESGIPLGGIGTGSFEIRADGKFYEWQIFNNKPWRCGGAPWEREQEEFMRPNDFFFAVRAKPEGDIPIVRILGFGAMDLELGYDPYTLPWVKGVESIEYVGEYPLVTLDYLDQTLPVKVKLEAFSPFIPGEVKDSSLPVAVFVFKLSNPMDKPVEVSILACLKNPVGRFVQGRRCVNKVSKETDRVTIHMSAEGVPETHPTYGGSMALTVLDPNASFEAGLPARNQAFKRMWVDLRSDGLLESSQSETSSLEEVYGLLCSKTSLEPGEEKEMVFTLSWFFPNHIDTKGNLIGHMYENWFKDASDVAAYVASNLERLRKITGLFHETLYDTSLDYWIVDAVSAQLTTLVKSSFFTKDGVFALWEGGPGCCGLETLDVTFYGSIPIALLFPELEKRQIRLTASFQLKPDSPRYEDYVLGFPENRLALAKKALKDPRILSDPKRWKEALLEVVKETGLDPRGRIPHFFPGTFKEVDAYHMVDLMPKYALLVYRDFLWTGDESYLRELWESVKEALDNVLRTMDPAGKKLPYHYAPSGFEFMRGVLTMPMGFQTYDVWSFLGYSAYVCGIWLSALKAAEAMAKTLGDFEYAEKVKAIYQEARRNFEEMLWNGEYYSLWYDPISGVGDDGCMTDQLCGQWYANLTELPPIAEKRRIISALKAVLRYNMKPDEGLINGSYPKVGVRPAMNGDMTYPNKVGMPWRVGSQPDTPWTGTEYAVASLMVQEGLVEEGLAVAKNVYDRYARVGLPWNHIECGGHYYRAMDVWALLMALEGFSYDASEARITFTPRVSENKFKAPFAANGSWGSLIQTRDGDIQRDLVKLRHGELEVRSIVLKLPAELDLSKVKVEASLAGERVETCLEAEGDGRVRVKLENAVKLSPGRDLEVVLSW